MYMVAQKFKSFGITVRPRDGVDDQLLQELNKWFNKQEFVYAVTEKEGSERHVHIQTWHEPKYASDVKKQMVRICSRTVKDWDRAQQQHAVYVKACWLDWYDQYLENNPDKPEEVNTLIDKVPDNTMDYYPDEDEDEKMHKASSAVDKTFHELNEELTKYVQTEEIEEVTKMTIAKFLHVKQHVDKTMKVIREQKVARALVNTLYAHHTQKFDASWYLPDVESTNTLIAKVVAQLGQQESPDLT